MSKRIAMLLNGEIKNDHRVIKIINTLSREYLVDLFYVNGDSIKDNFIFSKNVSLFSFRHQASKKINFLRHSFFCYEFNFFIKCVLNAKKSYDIIWANDLPTLYPAFKISQKLNCKLIYDSHEIYVETINQFFPKQASFFKNIFFSILIKLMRNHGYRIEKKGMSNTDLLITVNESLLEYFHGFYDIRKGISIMNLPKNEDTSVKESMNYRELFSWALDSRIVIYQGQLNEGRGLKILIDSFKELSETYKLIILGNGPLKPFLIDKVNQLNLNNRIRFIDTVPLCDLPSYTLGADIGVNLLESFNLSKKLASPNKLFEYIHAGIPVVASNSPENLKVFKKYSIGQMTNNFSNEIAFTIQSINNLDKESLKTELLEAKKFYTWENQEVLLLSSIKEL
jgi:glycosyltransferase involved in cell wall biosynthesis